MGPGPARVAIQVGGRRGVLQVGRLRRRRISSAVSRLREGRKAPGLAWPARGASREILSIQYAQDFKLRPGLKFASKFQLPFELEGEWPQRLLVAAHGYPACDEPLGLAVQLSRTLLNTPWDPHRTRGLQHLGVLLNTIREVPRTWVATAPPYGGASRIDGTPHAGRRRRWAIGIWTLHRRAGTSRRRRSTQRPSMLS